MSGLTVMHVIESMHRGGAESLVIEHVRHAGAGVRTLVCALNHGGPALEQALAAGADAFVLGKGQRRFSGLRHLADRLRAERVSIVNGHNPVGGLYGTLAATLAGVAVVRTEHSIPYSGRGSRGYGLVEPLLVLRAARVIGVCRTVRDRHAARHRWAAGRFVAIDNGISALPAEPARDAVRGALGVGDAPVALAIGSLTPQKDHATLLAAFAAARERVSAARLLIAGAGPLAAALRARASALGLDGGVHWLGDRADAADLLAAADVFVLSSRREGLPITLLEAMRAGRAAVATDVGGTAEALVDGVTGRLVRAGDATALGNALEALLSDRTTRDAMGRASAARWAERYTAERMVASTEALYREVLGRAVRTPGAAVSRGATA